MAGRDDLASKLYYSMLEYTKDIEKKAEKEAKDIQKNYMLRTVTELSPYREHKRSEPVFSSQRGYINIYEPDEDHFRDSWETTKRIAVRKGNAFIYGVRNKKYQLTHLLNFDHAHYSGFLRRFTGMTHQKHAGFVDKASELAQKMLDERIEKIIHEKYEG